MKISRRTFLKTTAVTAGSLVALDLEVAAQSPAYGQSAGNPIALENQQPGTPGWFTTNPARHHEIEGYASQVSAIAGDSVQLFVSTTAASYTVSLYRLGWYGGVGARLVAQYGPLQGILQPTPSPDPTTGLVECQWQSTLSVPISANWTTGSYLFRLERPDGVQSYIPLVIRSQQPADLLFQCSTTTYQAYNQWGGESLYYTATGGPARTHAFVVSFDRPYDTYDGNAPGAGQALLWEYPTLRWLERQGYNLAYTSANDTHVNGGAIQANKVFLSVGHDEYYSKQMYDAVQGARDAGVSLMFMSANVCYWQVRFDASAAGSNRRIICYKDYAYTNDPLYGVNNSMVTTNWRDPLVNRPENGLLGVMYQSYGHLIPYHPFGLTLATDPEFAGIAPPPLQNAPIIAGYEFDSIWPNGATPPGIEILASSSMLDASAMPGLCQSVRYTAPSGAKVFAAGTIAWGWGLENWQTLVQGRGDQTCVAIQQVTTQLLRDALIPPVPTGATQLNQIVAVQPSNFFQVPGQQMTLGSTVGGNPAAPVIWSVSPSNLATIDQTGYLSIAQNAPDGAQIQVTATSAQYPGQSGKATVTVQMPRTWNVKFLAGTYDNYYADGPVATAMFMKSTGLAADASGNVYVADAAGGSIRMISNGVVSTLAGGAGAGGKIAGVTGFKDGQGAATQFNHPYGMVMANGQLYVTDAFNHAVRIVQANGNVTTYAGTGKQGFADGPVAQALFNVPTGIAADPRGFLYIADTANHAIRRISPDGDVVTIAGTGVPGFVDGPFGQSQLYYPYGVAWTNAGLVITDTGNHAVRLLDAGNNLTTLAGTGFSGSQDGAGTTATFYLPIGITPMPGGALWIADWGNGVVRALDPATGNVTTVLGSVNGLGQKPGTDNACEFLYPVALASGPDGSLYLSDYTFIYHITSRLQATGIQYLDLWPNTIDGGLTATGQITLNGVAFVDTVVALSTTNPATSVPATVTVPSSSMTARFPITTQTVASAVTGNIIAAANGVQINAPLTVTPIGFQSLVLTPPTVTGSQGATVTVNLDAPAAPGDILVTLTSSDPRVTVPATLRVPAGATTASGPITTQPVATETRVRIAATANGHTTTRTLKVEPVAPASLVINPYTIGGSLSAIATVTMNGTTVADTAVTLGNTNLAATVPASVIVPAGSSSASFTITTQAVATVVTGNVTATANGATVSAYMAVRPIGPLSFNVAPSTVIGGQGATGTLTLEAPAAPGSITVTFTSTDSTVSIPTSIVIPAGGTVATAQISTQPVTSPKSVLLTATANGRSTSRSLTIQSTSPASLTINPYTVLGGQSAVGAVTLNQATLTALTVALSSSDPSASVPATVIIPAGGTSATFTVATQIVAANTAPVITGAANGASATGNMTVRAAGPASLALNPATVLGSQSSTGTVTLEQAAPAGGVVVTLTSSDPSATTPGSITVPAGSTTANFTIATSPVASVKSATITATANSRSTSRTLTVQAVAPASVTVTPSTVVGSTNAVGTVTLNGVAAAAVVVALSSSNPAAVTPASVTVPAGNSSAGFTISTQAVTSVMTGNIIATANGTTANGYIAVRPIGPLSLSLNPGTVTAGQTSTGTVTLEAPAAPGNLVATLTSSDPSVTVPGSITIASGNTTGTFTITTTPSASGKSVTITVSVNGRATSKTLVVR